MIGLTIGRPQKEKGSSRQPGSNMSKERSILFVRILTNHNLIFDVTKFEPLNLTHIFCVNLISAFYCFIINAN